MRRALLISAFVLACGGSAPPPPPHEPTIVLNVPDNYEEHLVSDWGGSYEHTHIFRLDNQIPIPSNASEVYVEVSGCLYGQSNPGNLTAWSLNTTTENYYIDLGCEFGTANQIAAWFPLTANHIFEVQADDATGGGDTFVMAGVTVKGWKIP